MIFFDIDGTLHDHLGAERAGALAIKHAHPDAFPGSDDEHYARWHRIAEKHVRRYLAGELSYQQQRRERLRELFAGHRVLTDAEADAVFARYQERYTAGWRLYPDALPCLDALAGRALGIISNGDGAQQRAKLAALSIAGRFAVIVVSGEVGAAKPDPAIFARACILAGLPPARCVYVGDDADTDAVGARRAGLRGIWLNRQGLPARPGLPTIVTLGQLDAALAGGEP
jgi:putative hydrolase of the HAD superfamily